MTFSMLPFFQGELHVDMVRFSPPATVQEVRVIPQNVKAHANFSETVG